MSLFSHMQNAVFVTTKIIYSVRNKPLPTCPSWVEFAGGKLKVSEGCPLNNLIFQKTILFHFLHRILHFHYKSIIRHCHAASFKQLDSLKQYTFKSFLGKQCRPRSDFCGKQCRARSDLLQEQSNQGLLTMFAILPA